LQTYKIINNAADRRKFSYAAISADPVVLMSHHVVQQACHRNKRHIFY